MIILLMKAGLLVFLLARRFLPYVVWPREVRRGVLEAFAESPSGYPECVVFEKHMPHVSHRRKWRVIMYCRRQGWLDWDMMVRINAAGLDALHRLRGAPIPALPPARVISARSHP